MKDYPSRFSALLVHVAASCTAWMTFCQRRLFTSLWIMKRMHSLYKEIDTINRGLDLNFNVNE